MTYTTVVRAETRSRRGNTPHSSSRALLAFAMLASSACSSDSTEGRLTSVDGGVSGGAGGTSHEAGSAGGGAGGLNGTGGTETGARGGGGGAQPDAGAGGRGGSDAMVPDATAPPTWKLWVAAGGGSTGHLYGYEPAALQTTNGDEPAIDIVTPSGLSGLRFDRAGNLWAMMGHTLVEFPAAALARSGSANPSFSLGSFLYFAFDPDANLWVNTNVYDGFLYRVDHARLAANPTGDFAFSLTPSDSGTELAATFDLKGTFMSGWFAFDSAGNLYGMSRPAGYPALSRYDASQLTGTGVVSDPPAMVLGAVGTGSGPWSYFDGKGRLIVSAGQSGSTNYVPMIVRYTASQIGQEGTNVQTTPESRFALADGNPIPYCTAVDPDGNLWAAGGTGVFVKVKASDFAQTGPSGSGTITLTPVVKIRAPVSNAAAQFCALAPH